MTNFGSTMQNMLTMQTNSATVIAAVVVGKGRGRAHLQSPSLPPLQPCMFLNPKLIKWNC